MTSNYMPLQFQSPQFLPQMDRYNPMLLSVNGSGVPGTNYFDQRLVGSMSSQIPGSSIPVATGGGGWWENFNKTLKDSGFLTSTDKNGLTTQGWGGMAFAAGQGLLNAYTGMKQLDLFKDQLAFQKESFNKNYEAQRSTINTQLEDRQRARVASNSGAYQSVGEYMDKNRIK